MNLKILLLVQLLILVATATRESLENREDSETVALERDGSEEEQQDEELEENELYLPRLDPADCQFQDIKRCNQKFKSSFQTRTGTTTRREMELYCNGMQSFMNCLEASTCNGPFIDKNRYVVLQHGMMDKKANLCPNHAYAKLITKVKAIRMKHLFIDDIGADNASECSIKVHKKCVKVFTRNMERNSNMCQDVQSFLTCYEMESPKCRSKITKHFAHLCSQLGDQMLKASEKHRGLMC